MYDVADAWVLPRVTARSFVFLIDLMLGTRLGVGYKLEGRA